MIGNLFSSLAMKVSGGIILALLIALGVVMWRADAISADREDLRNKLAAEHANHAVTRQSLAVLENELRQMVEDGQLRASRLAEAQREQRGRTQALRDQAARIRADVASGGDPCVTPDAVREARGL